jgi:dynein heavy chain 2
MVLDLLHSVSIGSAVVVSAALSPLNTAKHVVHILTILAGQLLSLAIQHEQPELEARKAQLLQQESSQKLQLTELEKQLLQALATSR